MLHALACWDILAVFSRISSAKADHVVCLFDDPVNVVAVFQLRSVEMSTRPRHFELVARPPVKCAALQLVVKFEWGF